FDTFINNAVSVDNYKDGHAFSIKARSYRLNYKPFTYNIEVKSDVAAKGMVRIFLGPSWDEEYYSTEDFMYYNFYKFVEMDSFIYDLKVGVNNIERLSTDSLFVAKDWPGTDYFYKKLLKAIEGNEPFTYGDKVFGFPNNLYLPKGRVGGMPYKLFVFVYPVEESKMTTFSLP
ncbi:hypothetical protein, partial [Staphylococcus haemolyticus]|uniref:hypothetical protein n=1 Tax=Staphylococcus haemolyticus TaxID=1283 RepID=UPI000A8B9C01